MKINCSTIRRIRPVAVCFLLIAVSACEPTAPGDLSEVDGTVIEYYELHWNAPATEEIKARICRTESRFYYSKQFVKTERIQEKFLDEKKWNEFSSIVNVEPHGFWDPLVQSEHQVNLSDLVIVIRGFREDKSKEIKLIGCYSELSERMFSFFDELK